MAKTTYIDIVPELEPSFFSGLQSGDRFVCSRIRMKNVFFSRKAVKGLTQKSLLPQIAERWAILTTEQKEKWSEAASQCGLNGWRLFVKDNCLRIKNEMSGIAEPSDYHQARVGCIALTGDASEAKIIQIHPHFYYISKKVYGKKGMYVAQKIAEDLTLPFTLSFNYSSNLESFGIDAYFGTAKFGICIFGSTDSEFCQVYARFFYSYQGQTLELLLPINCDLVSTWKNSQATLNLAPGYLIKYDVIIHISGLQGEFYFDNIKLEHDSVNFARDKYCDDIDQSFTRAFYQIPKHWAAEIMPSGAWFGSIYKDF